MLSPGVNVSWFFFPILAAMADINLQSIDRYEKLKRRREAVRPSVALLKSNATIRSNAAQTLAIAD